MPRPFKFGTRIYGAAVEEGFYVRRSVANCARMDFDEARPAPHFPPAPTFQCGRRDAEKLADLTGG
jgi:hypothetical protein